MNEIDNTVERVIEAVQWVDGDTPLYDDNGHFRYNGKSITVNDLKALANAYTKAVADNEKLRACAEHYAAQKDMTVKCGACGFENHRRANRDRAQQTLDAIGKE